MYSSQCSRAVESLGGTSKISGSHPTEACNLVKEMKFLYCNFSKSYFETVKRSEWVEPCSPGYKSGSPPDTPLLHSMYKPRTRYCNYIQEFFREFAD